MKTNIACLYSHQLFHQLFRVGKLVSDVLSVFNCQPIKTRALFTRFICMTVRKMGDASLSTLLNLSKNWSLQFSGSEGRFICSPQRYRLDYQPLFRKWARGEETRLMRGRRKSSLTMLPKKKKMKQPAAKLGSSNSFYSSAAFCFFFSFLLFHSSTWVPLH